MINISLSNIKETHSNLKIQVGCMKEEIVADIYYYLISLTEEEKPLFKDIFLNFLNKVINYTRNLKPNEQINIPIALYDEYTDFIVVREFGSKGICNLYYCSAHIEGWRIQPFSDIHIELNQDLVFAYLGGVYCTKDEILNSLRESIYSIKTLEQNRTN